MRVFYGKVGRSIDVPSTEKFLEIMGVPKSNTTVCDENCRILSEGKTSGSTLPLFWLTHYQMTNF